jgi:RNA polymerase sigma-70 factor (ECF subfamily)
MLQFISEQDYDQSDPKRAEQYTHLSDRNVIRKILNGDSFLFSLLVRRYNDRLFRILRSYLSDEEAIKDALQQTYMRAYEYLDSWRGNAQFSTWITRIAINEALKHIKKRKRYSDLHSFNLNSGEETPLAGKNEKTPEDDLIQKDLKRSLK